MRKALNILMYFGYLYHIHLLSHMCKCDEFEYSFFNNHVPVMSLFS